MGSSYLTRFRCSRDKADATAAKEILRELTTKVPRGRRDRFKCLLDTAELCFEPVTGFQDPGTAVQLLVEAITDNHRDVRSRLRGAIRLLHTFEEELRNTYAQNASFQQHIMDVYETPRVAYFGLDAPSRLTSLAIGQDIAAISASHALELFQLKRAVAILEQGRAIFCTHVLRLRSQFDLLPEEFRPKLLSLAQQLERSSELAGIMTDQCVIERAVARRRQQGDEFNTLLGQVRDLEGFGRFMLAEESSTLGKVADRGPVVILVSSRHACHAILVQY